MISTCRNRSIFRLNLDVGVITEVLGGIGGDNGFAEEEDARGGRDGRAEWVVTRGTAEIGGVEIGAVVVGTAEIGAADS